METIARRNLVKTAAVAGAAVVAGSVAAAPLAHAAEETASVEELAQKLLAMEERLWDLEAKEAIRYKLSLYPRGLDRQDTSIGLRVFAEDAYIDYGTAPDGSWDWQGTGPEWIDCCTNTIDKGITARGGYYAHEIFNICIEVNGDKAGSEYYGCAPVMTPHDDGTYTWGASVARYNDKWECREGDWVIVERIVTNDFQWKIDGARLGEPYGCAFDESDPSYSALAYGMAEEE